MEALPAAIRFIKQELLPRAKPQNRRRYEQVARFLERAQRVVQRRRQRETPSDTHLGIPPPTSANELREWGLQLRKRRERAGLARLQLAALSGVNDSTIRNLETYRHKASRAIIMRLQAVPVLGMPQFSADASLAASAVGAHPSGVPPFACNCWFAPEYDSIQMARDMVRRLSSSGGYIEPMYLFADPAAAAAWCAFAEQDDWAQVKALLPMRDVTQAIKQASNALPLDIIGLGPGQAHDEVRLVQSLVGEQEQDLRLFLLEISQPLLSAGYQHAAQVLGEVPSVGIYAIQGNFYHLPRYTPLLATHNRRRLCCMFGYTFSSLENEISFVRYNLCGFHKGDLLLIDVPKACASPTQPKEEIMKLDPSLARSSERLDAALSAEAALYEGLFERHVPGLRSIKLKLGLELSGCPIPGSYAAAWRAHVRTDSDPEREFLVALLKRYEPRQLHAAMSQNGWELLQSWDYADESHPSMLALYRKRSSLTVRRKRSPGNGSGQTKPL
jgi:transcriptional regulator with XRE-family HTH domain